MSANEKYSYLKKFINNAAKPPRNWFGVVSEEDIRMAEAKAGFKFPKALKEFWLQIGYGALYMSADNINAYDYANCILTPNEIASIILKEEDAPMILDYNEDYVHDGDIPFFEIMNSSDFLFMKRDSEVKDTVYDSLGHIVEEHFENFIQKLYFESPTYYEKIIRKNLGIAE